MAKVYARKIRQLVTDGKLDQKDVPEYIEENVPEKWRDDVRDLLKDLID